MDQDSVSLAEPRYGPIAQFFHWSIFLLLAVSIPLGIYMTDLEFSPRKLMLYGWHEWIGLTVWALAVARILWRRRHPPPAALASIPPWQHRIAELVHWTLYGLLLALPLIGWAGNSALGFQVVLYGVLPLPPLAPEHKALGFTLLALHGWLGWGMLLLVGMHAGAALQHHFLARDATLRRMLPRGRWGGER